MDRGVVFSFLLRGVFEAKDFVEVVGIDEFCSSEGSENTGVHCLNEGEQAVLCDYISGQYSDGWGEGFEQRDICG